LRKAADQHEEAANQYSTGNMEKGASAAEAARGHREEADTHAKEASKKHASSKK